jgi:hypothetical protein
MSGGQVAGALFDFQLNEQGAERPESCPQPPNGFRLAGGLHQRPQSWAAVVEAFGNLAVLADLRGHWIDGEPAADVLQKDAVGMSDGIPRFGPILVAGEGLQDVDVVANLEVIDLLIEPTAPTGLTGSPSPAGSSEAPDGSRGNLPEQEPLAALIHHRHIHRAVHGHRAGMRL